MLHNDTMQVLHNNMMILHINSEDCARMSVHIVSVCMHIHVRMYRSVIACVSGIQFTTHTIHITYHTTPHTPTPCTHARTLHTHTQVHEYICTQPSDPPRTHPHKTSSTAGGPILHTFPDKLLFHFGVSLIKLCLGLLTRGHTPVHTAIVTVG